MSKYVLYHKGCLHLIHLTDTVRDPNIELVSRKEIILSSIVLELKRNKFKKWQDIKHFKIKDMDTNL